MEILPRSFYERETASVARNLLGRVISNRTPEGMASGIIVETEAYLGENDPGSHASIRKTPRNSVMFGRAGIAYVYFTYGMHYCFNAVAKPPGRAGAVLVRAIEPLEGLNLMRSRRGREDLLDLASGPAKLTQALGIGREHNGVDLTQGYLTICEGPGEPHEILNGTRVGLSKGQGLPLRFAIRDSPFVSRAIR
jgi:DNA-3-methyladenine glycosylase